MNTNPIPSRSQESLSANVGSSGQAQPPENLIEADSINEGDTDSALGDDDVASSTESLKSSVTKYVVENGRRYHSPEVGGLYYLPNDEAELDRLDLFHHLLTLRMNGKLHLAPISQDVQRILDIGTGTGIWAIEMGDKYPSSQVLGNDLSPVQPLNVPPNVSFEVDDVELDWVYNSAFDFIHCRYLCGCIKQWKRLVQQAYTSLKPGAWLELQDFDMKLYTNKGEFNNTLSVVRWVNMISSGIQSLGREPSPGYQLEGWMKEAGFVNVKSQLLAIPVGPWPRDKNLKEVGSYNLLMFLEGLEGLSLRIFTGVFKWEVEEVMILLAQVRKDMLSKKTQIQHDFYIVYGQKPPEIAE